ncbi:hypothetical protein Ciccas_003620 [Cichlidogyrus casuarinus]|uniref:Uncharacterized protein n=1 Tax=Cichlidogyrus casuarinus TaxID=1844966 RepID=A0ABD2QEM6_9PLAT
MVDYWNKEMIAGFMANWTDASSFPIESVEHIFCIIRFATDCVFKSICCSIDEQTEEFVDTISSWIAQAADVCSFELHQFFIFCLFSSASRNKRISLGIVERSVHLMGVSLAILFLSGSSKLHSPKLSPQTRHKLLSTCVECFLNRAKVEPVVMNDDLLELLKRFPSSDLLHVFLHGQDLIDKASHILTDFLQPDDFTLIFWPLCTEQLVLSWKEHLFSLMERLSNEMENWQLPRCISLDCVFSEKDFVTFVRLLLVGTSLGWAVGSEDEDLVLIAGVARACLNLATRAQLNRVIDQCEIPQIAFLANSSHSQLLDNFNQFWWHLTERVSVEKLVQLQQHRRLSASPVLRSLWHTTLFMRLRHTHPSDWFPDAIHLAKCSKTDWLTLPADQFNLLTESLLPASVYWRFQNKADVVKYLNEALQASPDPTVAERIFHLIVVFAAIRSTAPTYLGACLHLLLTDTPLNLFLKSSCADDCLIKVTVQA